MTLLRKTYISVMADDSHLHNNNRLSREFKIDYRHYRFLLMVLEYVSYKTTVEKQLFIFLC